MKGEPILKVRNLRTTFETDEAGPLPAVDGISFEIQPGEVLGLVGESGSGKSVTALSIMRLIESSGNITADEITYEGTDLLDASESEMQVIRGGEISMIFQDPMHSLNPVISVGEQIAEVVRYHGDVDERTSLAHELKRKYVTGPSKDSESWRKAIELLEKTGISDPETRATEYPHQLSGGMIQRVMIAQALAGDPSLIIADEPTTALDVSVEAQILNELERLKEEFGVSMLFITHDLGVIREICDRAAVMYAGELMEVNGTDDLFTDPRHPYTQGLFRSIPDTSEDKRRLYVLEGSVPSLTDKPTGCPFRDRCEKEFGLCDQPLIEYSDGPEDNSVYCHLYNDHVETDEDDTYVTMDEQRALTDIRDSDGRAEPGDGARLRSTRETRE